MKNMIMIKEDDYKAWFWELGLPDEIIENIIWYDKGYAWVRVCIDNYIAEDNVVNFVRFIYENNINDSRDLNKDLWKKYIRKYSKDDVHDLLRFSKDAVTIPGLMDFIKPYNNIDLCGGGINECLKEVEICLKALNKTYRPIKQFIY